MRYQNIWLMKTNRNGEMIWSHLFGGTSDEYVRPVHHTSDNGYIIGGSTESYGSGDFDFWLIKTDEFGKEQWNKTYGKEGYDFGEWVAQTNDGGYIQVGYTYSISENHSYVWLIKTDENGEMLWNKYFGGPWRSGIGHHVEQTNDNGYIIVGGTYLYGSKTNLDVWLIKTDMYGNMMWHKTYDGIYEDFGYAVTQTEDNGYIITGWTGLGIGFQPFLGMMPKTWIIKTDSNGSILWEKKLGLGFGIGRSVKQTTDGGYIIAGNTGSFQYPNKLLLIKTNGQGENTKMFSPSKNISKYCITIFGRSII